MCGWYWGSISACALKLCREGASAHAWVRGWLVRDGVLAQLERHVVRAAMANEGHRVVPPTNVRGVARVTLQREAIGSEPRDHLRPMRRVMRHREGHNQAIRTNVKYMFYHFQNVSIELFVGTLHRGGNDPMF